MVALEAALARLRDSTVLGDNAALTRIALDVEIALAEFDAFPEEPFETLARLLMQKELHTLPDSWKVMKVIADNWELLSPDQKEQVRSLVVDTFDKFADWMGAFVAAEVIGGRYPSKWAVDELARLSREASMPARALVAHGLEVLAETTTDHALRSAAVSVLTACVNDREPEVRREASSALERLGRKISPS